MTHAERILALPPDTLLYNIYNGDRYVMEHLEPQWTDLGKTKAYAVKNKLDGETVDIALLRPVGEKRPWRGLRVYGDHLR